MINLAVSLTLIGAEFSLMMEQGGIVICQPSESLVVRPFSSLTEITRDQSPVLARLVRELGNMYAWGALVFTRGKNKWDSDF